MNVKYLPLILLLLIQSLFASELVFDEKYKQETRVLNDDYLFLGERLDFSGEAKDLYFLGERLTYNGKISDGVIAFGEKLMYEGDIHDGIISAGETVTIKGNSTGTHFLAGNEVHITKEASINGDLYVGAAKLIIDGPVNGKIYAGTGEIVINNGVTGNVQLHGGKLSITEQGKITGDLTYAMHSDITEEEKGRVTGTTTFKEETDEFHIEGIESAFTAIGLIIRMVLFASFIISGSLLLLLPVFRKITQKRTEKEYYNTALWGLIPFFMYPAVVLLFIFFGVTIPFAGILLLAAIPVLFLAKLLGLTLIGQFLSEKFKWNITKRHYHFLIALGISVVLSWIPFVNFLTFLAVTCTGLGLMTSFLFDKRFDS